MKIPEFNTKSFQIHVEYMTSNLETTVLSSEIMTFYDCLKVKRDYPSSVITFIHNGKFKSMRTKQCLV